MPRLSIDKILSGRAVLVDEEANAWEIPAQALPPGCAEGDMLDIRLRKPRGGGKKLQQEIQNLQEQLKKLKRRSVGGSTEE